MTVIKYLLHCLVAFFDSYVGNGGGVSWLEIAVAAILIFIMLAIYFSLYWKVISPRCYRLWLCTVLTFLACIAILGTFILLLIGGEWIIRGVF